MRFEQALSVTAGYQPRLHTYCILLLASKRERAILCPTVSISLYYLSCYILQFYANHALPQITPISRTCIHCVMHTCKFPPRMSFAGYTAVLRTTAGRFACCWFAHNAAHSPTKVTIHMTIVDTSTVLNQEEEENMKYSAHHSPIHV